MKFGTLPAKTTPVDADGVLIVDSANSNKGSYTLWSNIKATLKTYFDTLYHIVGGTDIPIADGGTGASSAATAFDNLKQAASDTATGVVERLTDAEFTTGTDTTRYPNAAQVAGIAQTMSNKKLILAAGLSSLAPLKYTSGTNLTTPEAGAAEFDGDIFYKTANTTNGRMQVRGMHIFRLAANGSAIGTAAADFFGANSAIPTVTNGVYRIVFDIYFLKSTAGTVTYNIVNTQTYTNLVASYIQTAIAGIQTNAAMTTGGIAGTTTAYAGLPVTGSLANGAYHHAIITCLAECGTAGNIRLQTNESAGTITPQRGSYFTAERLYAGNVGIFPA